MKYDDESVQIATKILWGLASVFALGLIASLMIQPESATPPATFAALILACIALATVAPGQVRAYLVWGGWWPFL